MSRGDVHIHLGASGPDARGRSAAPVQRTPPRLPRGRLHFRGMPQAPAGTVRAASAQPKPANARAAAVAEIARYDASRTRWHMLFAAGTTEMRYEISFKPGTDDDPWPDLIIVEKEFEFTPDVLEGYVATYLDWRKHSARHGMPSQDLPCSYMHLIEERLCAGWYPHYDMLRLNELLRAGSIPALHYHPGDASNPAGIYGLHEWTDDAMRAINQGAWAAISPTTWSGWRETDGRVWEEEQIRATALVDVGALNSIGVPRDGLEVGAFPVPADVRFLSSPIILTPDATRNRAATTPEDAMATKRNNETLPTADPETPAEPITTDTVQEMIDRAVKPIADEVTTMRSAVESGFADLRSLLAPAAGDTAPAPAAPAPNAAPATPDDGDAEIARAMAASKAALRQAAIAEAQAHVAARSLLPHDMPTYVQHVLRGKTDDAAAMLGDFAVPELAATTSRSGDPAPKPGKWAPRVNEVALKDQAQREKGPEGPRAVLARFNALVAEVEAAGSEIYRRGEL